MLQVDDYGAIRRARRDGLSIHQIAERFGHSRNTVRKVLRQNRPGPPPAPRDRPAPLLGPFLPIIDQILLDDQTAPTKQRHTAVRIYERLRDDHDYLGGYDQVRRYVADHRPLAPPRETFIPLDHLPGNRLEVDFGHIHVDFPDARRLVPFFVSVWAYSNAPFAIALPFERLEAVFLGLVSTFEFFQRVPKQVWWDNPKTAVLKILVGRDRQINPHYASLANHYLFDPLFCMPRRGNEKPDAESAVKAVQKRFSTPVPQVADLDELNLHFRQQCLNQRQHVVRSLKGPFTIQDRFVEDLDNALPLPAYPFDACITRQAASVDKYQTISFDSSRYSVPRPFAHQSVTVKAYANQIVITYADKIIASHDRSFSKHAMVLDPIHYLATLARKPGALNNSAVFRDWQLPECFNRLRSHLEQRHGTTAGARQYITVLQLLSSNPLARVAKVIEECEKEHIHNAEIVVQRTKLRAEADALSRNNNHETTFFDHDNSMYSEIPIVKRVQVPIPNLNRFDQLLGQENGENQAEGDVV